MILALCDNSATLSAMRIVRLVINIIRIFVPIILIVSLMINYFLAVKDSSGDALAQANRSTIRKVVAAVLVFFVPTIFNVIVDSIRYDTSSLLSCYKSANSANINKALEQETETYINKAKKTLNRSDYNLAKSKVNSIQDDGSRQKLESELSEVLKEIEAKEEKEKAEKKRILEEIEAAIKSRRWKGAKFWWPIGSVETTEEDGVLFAKGAPASTSITATFGGNDKVHQGLGGGHGALDIGASTGTYVIAAEDGTVTFPGAGDRIDYPDSFIKPDSNGKYNCAGLVGNKVVIDHGNGYKTVYNHLYKNTIVVRAGDQVKKGQVIGQVGSSGCSTGPHLHFEVQINGQKVDPEEYVNPKNPR